MATAVLFASERGQWLAFNGHKGWTVLLAVAVMGVALFLLAASKLLMFVFGRRSQFSLRSLLLLVVAVALPLGWLAAELRLARRQAAAVAAIYEIDGGSVCHEFEVLYLPPGDPRINVTGVIPCDRPAPELLCNLLGYDFFSNVEDVKIRVQSVTDSCLERLTALPRLKTLTIEGGEVTDAGLSHFEELTSLQELWLDNTEVTVEGLKILRRGLPNCKIHFNRAVWR
jgi:hypothetical protein